jgi:NADPH2:quinone reductase
VYAPAVIRAIRLHHTGGPDALELDEISTPIPGPGQALVRHHAIGLNFIDTYHRSGLYPLPVLPHGIGMEAAGIVEALGPEVSGLAVGARVAYSSGPPGAYSEARVMDADRLVALPDAIDFETAAAMLLKGTTVEYLIRRCRPVESGMTVLWHAAAGGVGLIACQWLAHLGVTVIGTVGSREKAELARRHGCAHTIVYTEESFVDRVRELTGGEGVPVVFDSVGRDTFMGSLDCLSRRGMLVSFGNASGKPEPFDIGILASKGGLYVTRPILWAYTGERAELLESARALFEVVEQGAVKIEINQRWPLARATEAHRALEARRTTGASLLMP